jgi:CRISPR/Cas system-associated endonuclease Cas1
MDAGRLISTRLVITQAALSIFQAGGIPVQFLQGRSRTLRIYVQLQPALSTGKSRLIQESQDRELDQVVAAWAG